MVQRPSFKPTCGLNPSFSCYFTCFVLLCTSCHIFDFEKLFCPSFCPTDRSSAGPSFRWTATHINMFSLLLPHISYFLLSGCVAPVQGHGPVKVRVWASMGHFAPPHTSLPSWMECTARFRNTAIPSGCHTSSPIWAMLSGTIGLALQPWFPCREEVDTCCLIEPIHVVQTRTRTMSLPDSTTSHPRPNQHQGWLESRPLLLATCDRRNPSPPADFVTSSLELPTKEAPSSEVNLRLCTSRMLSNTFHGVTELGVSSANVGSDRLAQVTTSCEIVVDRHCMCARTDSNMDAGASLAQVQDPLLDTKQLVCSGRRPFQHRAYTLAHLQLRTTSTVWGKWPTDAFGCVSDTIGPFLWICGPSFTTDSMSNVSSESLSSWVAPVVFHFPHNFFMFSFVRLRAQHIGLPGAEVLFRGISAPQ